MNKGLLTFPLGARAGAKRLGFQPPPGAFQAERFAPAMQSGNPDNTKSGWFVITEATNFETERVVLHLLVDGASNRDALFDIAIGRPGSEDVIISNVWAAKLPNNNRNNNVYSWDLRIPAGSRLSWRVQQSLSTVNCAIILHLMGRGQIGAGPVGKVEAVGVIRSDSSGTSFDPGATPNTKTAWVALQVEAGPPDSGVFVNETSFDYHSLHVGFSGQRDTTRVDATYACDIGIGAPPAVEMLLPDLIFKTGDFLDQCSPTLTGPIPCYIPAGSRVVARIASTTGSAGNRAVDIMAWGSNESKSER